MSTDEHTNMEFELITIDSTAVDSATAAAASAMSDLSDLAPSAIAGQLQIWRLAHLFPPLSLMLFNAHGSCAHCCVGVPLVAAGLLPRRDDFGYQLCELCPTRLNRAKGKLHLHPPGKICQKCYDNTRRPSSAAVTVLFAQPSTSVRSHKRKAGSDPGQQLHLATTVVASPSPAPPIPLCSLSLVGASMSHHSWQSSPSLLPPSLHLTLSISAIH